MQVKYFTPIYIDGEQFMYLNKVMDEIQSQSLEIAKSEYGLDSEQLS